LNWEPVGDLGWAYTAKAFKIMGFSCINIIGIETGWKPVIPLRDTIADMLEDWRKKLAYC
jgi:nucleoside-diphosphate-sugar epimerase